LIELKFLSPFETGKLSQKKNFLFPFTFTSGLFSSFKMYLQMNMSKYSSAKYSQVDDTTEENPSRRAAQTASNRPIPPPRNLKKWTSLRKPSNYRQSEMVQIEWILRFYSSHEIH